MSTRCLKLALAIALVAIVLPIVAMPASAQWQIETKDGKGLFKFGLLVQGQYEALESESATTGVKDTAQNLFVRRARLIFGGKYDKISYFVETDSPNLGKYSSTTGKKDAGNIYIQDAWITYTQSDNFMVDAGMFLVPVSYQSLQSAATLMAVDYGPYAFQDSTPTDQRVGRDYGFQVRGYPAGKHFEYRAGLAQGIRSDATDTKSNLPFRYFTRLQYHVFDTNTGFLYGGTSLGEKKMLDFGVSYGGQKDYKVYSGSVFFDWPFDGNGLTAQVDYTHYDGGTFLPNPTANPPGFGTLGVEKVLFTEVGFYIKAARLLPFAQYSKVDYDMTATASLPDSQDKWQVGLGWFPYGHKFNLKLGYAQFKKETSPVTPDQKQVVLQVQFFHF